MIDEALKEEHRALRGLAAELLDVARQRDGAAVSAVRWRLFRILLVHLAREESSVYAQMIAHGGAAAALANNYRAEMGDLGDALRQHFVDWPIERITSDWDGFEVDAAALVAKLARRIDREDAYLYPMAERISLRPAA